MDNSMNQPVPPVQVNAALAVLRKDTHAVLELGVPVALVLDLVTGADRVRAAVASTLDTDPEPARPQTTIFRADKPETPVTPDSVLTVVPPRGLAPLPHPEGAPIPSDTETCTECGSLVEVHPDGSVYLRHKLTCADACREPHEYVTIAHHYAHDCWEHWTATQNVARQALYSDALSGVEIWAKGAHDAACQAEHAARQAAAAYHSSPRHTQERHAAEGASTLARYWAMATRRNSGRLAAMEARLRLTLATGSGPCAAQVGCKLPRLHWGDCDRTGRPGTVPAPRRSQS